MATFSKLPTRQIPSFALLLFSFLLSKLPTRQIPIFSVRTGGLFFSKLPTRQIPVLYHTLNRVAT